MISLVFSTVAQVAVGLFFWFLICASARHFGDESLLLTAKPLANSIEERGEGYLALIGTVDGNIHAVDDHLNLLWTSSSGGPLLSTGIAEKGKLIPSLDGSLYVHGTGESMRKTSVTARFLAEQTPFVTKDHIAFRTTRQDSVIGFDVTDGSILRSKSHLIGDGGVLKLGASKRVVPLYLGREDFLIKATDFKSNTDAFNISFSDIHPLLEDVDSQDVASSVAFSSTSLLALLNPNSDSSIVSTPEGFVYFLDEEGNSINDFPVELQSPVTHVFLLRLDEGAVRSAVRMPVRYNLNNWRKMRNIRPGKSKSGTTSISSSTTTTPRLPTSNLNQPSIDDYDSTGYLATDTHLEPRPNEQQPSMVIIQQARDANNKDYTFAMEVPLPDDIGPSLRVDELLDDDNDISPANLPLLTQSSSTIDGNKVKADVSNFDGAQPLESIKSMKIRRPVSSLQQTIKSFRPSTAVNAGGDGSRSVSESLQLNSDEEDGVPVATSNIQNSFELQPLAESLIDTARSIHQIRGLHRLEAGKVNEEFWLPVLKKRSAAASNNNNDETVRKGNNERPLDPARASLGPSTLIIRLLESVFRSLLLVVAMLLSLLALFLVFMRKQSSLLEQPESIQLTIRLLVSILPQSRSYLSNIFPDLSRVERLPRSMFSLESLQQQAASTAANAKGMTESFVDENGMSVLKVGALNVYETVLGFGSHGTVVYSGTLNNRPVAVKRMLSILHKSAEREISLLIKSDGHPNVVRYFIKEERHDFIYLGLQLCIMSVKEFITKLQRQDGPLLSDNATVSTADSNCLVPDEVRLSLLQVAEGLAYLHSQRIVHRDIKPHNILCAPLQESSTVDEVLRGKQQLSITSLSQLGNYVLKISDMGLSKQLDRDSHSFSAMSLVSPTSRARRKSKTALSLDVASNDNLSVGATHEDEMQPDEVGTIGWQAPELITGRYTSHLGPNSNYSNTISTVATSDIEDSCTTVPLSVDQEKRRRTLNVDVFSLGCVFFYVLTSGGHPFGEWFQREANIAENKSDLSLLASTSDALDLVEWMLHPDPAHRPTSQQVTGHPFFWTASKRLEFLTDFSDLLEKDSAESPVILALESGASVIFKMRWDRALDKELLDDMGKFRKYDPFSVRDLLRVIRNKRHHFHELPASLKAKIGSVPAGYCSYFEQRFPRLLLHCMSVAKRLLRNEKLLEPWLCRLMLGSLPSPAADISPRVVTVFDQSLLHLIAPDDNNDDSPGLPLEASVEEDKVPFETVSSKAYEQQQEPQDTLLEDNGLQNVVVWQGGALQQRLSSKAWWRDAGDFSHASSLLKQQSSTSAKRQRASHLVRAAQDFKYRTRLCSHWEQSGGGVCPMRKKGKCTFAHGPLELRVKDTRRDKWPRLEADSIDSSLSLKGSGGEDVLGAARAGDYPRGDGTNSGNEFEKRSAPPPAPSLHFPAPYLYYPSYPAYPMYAPAPAASTVDNNKGNVRGR